MTEALHTLFQTGSLILSGAAIIFFILYLFQKNIQDRVFLLMLLVPATAGIAYFLMSKGVGLIYTPDALINVTRYADWIITTPILLFGLAYVSVHNKKKLKRIFLQLFTLDMFMLVTGFASEVVSNPNTRTLLFATSTLAFIGILYIIIQILLKEKAERVRDEQWTIALSMAWIVLVLWSLYPLIWSLGSTGTALVNQYTETLLYLLLDLTTKIGFLVLLYVYISKEKNNS